MKHFSVVPAQYLSLYALLLGLLAACGNGPDSALLAYVEQIKQSVPSTTVEKRIASRYELFVYQADSDGIRDPFISASASVVVRQALSSAPVPEERERGILESLPLESLVFIGNIEKRGRRVALVRSADGRVHQVRIGSYLGQNHGKVVEFNHHQITLQELVPDDQGGWHTRTATVGQSK